MHAKVQFNVQGESVEEFRVLLNGRLVEERLAEVNKIADWIHWKYRHSIQLNHNWEIILLITE